MVSFPIPSENFFARDKEFLATDGFLTCGGAARQELTGLTSAEPKTSQSVKGGDEIGRDEKREPRFDVSA